MSKRPRCFHVLAGVALASGIGAPSAPVLLGVQPVESPPPAGSGRSISEPRAPEQNTPSPTEGRTPPPADTKAAPETTEPEAPATPVR
jgi:hypothetical protein